MATCYYCGAPANQRKFTIRGFSSGGWSSRRSHGTSSRTNYGWVAVCDYHAREVNTYWTFRILIYPAIIILIVIYFSNSNSSHHTTKLKYVKSNFHSGKTLSHKGLNLRTEPNKSSNVIIVIPDNEEITILGQTDRMISLHGHKAYWYKIEYNGQEGWVWGRYIEPE